MNKKQVKDTIKELTVQIVTPKERGTGVLIRYKKRPHILTVQHVVYGKSKQRHPIEADEIILTFYNQAKVYAQEIKQLGELILLELDPKQLPLSSFYEVKFAKVAYEPNYYIRGFPSGLDKAHNFRAKCNDDAVDRERFKMELLDMTNDTSGEDAIEYMRGVSGSGIFYVQKKSLYLVGLVNALANQSGTFNSVYSLNLRKLIKKPSKPKKERSFSSLLWLGLVVIVGGLAFLFYQNHSVLEVLTPKELTVKENTNPKPSMSATVTDRVALEKENKIVEKIEERKHPTIEKKNMPSHLYKGKPIISPKDSTVYPKKSIIQPIKSIVYPIDNKKSPLK